MNKLFWHGKPWQAFKNIALLFSFLVNLLLIVVLLLTVPLLRSLVNDGIRPLVTGLNQSIAEMNQATIRRDVAVHDQVLIDFDLPLYTSTTVTLTQQVPLLIPATFYMTSMTLGNGGVIVGTVSLSLPADLALPVELGLEVPVENQLPVDLSVPVEIPLRETELGQPFARLQDLFGPLEEQINRWSPGSSADTQTVTPE